MLGTGYAMELKLGSLWWLNVDFKDLENNLPPDQPAYKRRHYSQGSC